VTQPSKGGEKTRTPRKKRKKTPREWVKKFELSGRVKERAADFKKKRGEGRVPPQKTDSKGNLGNGGCPRRKRVGAAGGETGRASEMKKKNC